MPERPDVACGLEWTSFASFALNGKKLEPQRSRRKIAEDAKKSLECLQLFSQQQSFAEASCGGSELFEAARDVKILGMGIPGYMERR